MSGNHRLCADSVVSVRAKAVASTLSPVVPTRFPLLFLNFSCLKVKSRMKSQTETLEIGSLAPGFSLSAANRDGTFTLDGLLERGLVDQRPLILEFLRGTW